MDQAASDLRHELLGIPDLDAPLYRVFPLWFFEEALRLGSLALFPPSHWDDPFEDICSKIFMVDPTTRPWTQESLEPYLKPTYAQCWSLIGDSDVLLRAYSRVSIDPVIRRNTEPRFEGVQVQTTPRLLFEQAKQWTEKRPGVFCCLGAVEYLDQKDLTQRVVDCIDRYGAEAVGGEKWRAQLLLLKRNAFRHEGEVRLVLTFQERPVPEGHLRLPVDPNALFQRVRFDPRLEPFERIERQQAATSLGFKGAFDDKGWYQGALFNAVLDRGWKRDLSSD